MNRLVMLNQKSSVEEFKKVLEVDSVKLFQKPINKLNALEQFDVLANSIKELMSHDWERCNTNPSNKKEIHYFSIEFLLGKQLKSIMLNRQIESLVKDTIEELGWNLDDIVKAEPEPAIANGGLGRLAACFIDSMATLQYAGYGQTIRYRHGLFKQHIVNNEQVELPDRWLDNGYYAWDTKTKEEYIVKFRGSVRFETDSNGELVPILENYEPIIAKAYDIPVPGYNNSTVNYLRTWEADVPSYDILEECGINYCHEDNMKRRRFLINQICEYLYPDDSTYEGKELRLKQEYFLCSAGVQSLINKFKNRGIDLKELDKYLAIHINDTHPSLVIPELMRILMDEEGLGWNKAWEVTTKVCSYTNHTIMQEALEVWPGHMLQSLIPRIYMIIQEIDRRYVDHLRHVKGFNSSKIDRMKIIDNYGNVRMANMDCMCCHSINGVAALHTEILKDETLNDFYTAEPEKFNNKTNGIAHRRWLLLSNPELCELIDNLLGTEWRTDLKQLKQLENFVNDEKVLEQLIKVKAENKRNFVKEMNLDISPDSIFDVQIKRIHMYKRQIMNVLRIIMIYNDLIENPQKPFYPMTFIMAGKAAAGYRSAKNVIKVFNMLADIINNDSRIEGKMKLVFIEDYNVSKAELIIPAADVSEQIPTASKEASGTSNMKFMMNGALTLGTLDGANVEITEYVGEDNIFLFGLQKDEVLKRYATWTDLSGHYIVNNNPKIKQAMEHLKTFNSAGNELYHELLSNDYFFTLTDLQEYVDKTYEVNNMYAQEAFLWAKKCLINIANSFPFTTDRTIEQYGQDIWFK